MKVFETAALSRSLAAIDLQSAKEEATTIVDLFVELLPSAKEYESALADFQKEAQGKKPEEVEGLVSAKAFEKIANKETEVSKTLTVEEIKAIGKHFRSVADIALLYNLKG